MTTPSTDRQRRLFVFFLLSLLAAGKVLDPCLDWDTWWHLRVGQFIVTEKQLPDYDPFSQLGQQEHVPWTAYSWIYELMLYGCFQLGGPTGVLLLRCGFVMMSWGGMGWFLVRHARNPWVGLGLLALVTIALRPFSTERPWHFTIFFTTLTLHAVIRIREGAPLLRFIWLPLVYALWANIHIQFVMGFAVLGFAWLVAMTERFIGKKEEAGPIASRLFVLGLACSVATLATPFHYRLYIVIWEYATQTTALKLVAELQPPDLLEWYSWPLIVLLLAASAATSIRGFRLWDLVFLGSAAFFSLRMQRDLWYGVLAASAVILHEKDDQAAPENNELSASYIAVLSLLAILIVRAAWELGLSQGKTIHSRQAELYPVEAVQFIHEHHLPGPLFNNFDWGGYLIWALPELPVSIDGRTNFYGEERLKRSWNTWAGKDWDKDPDLLKARVIIAPKKRGDNDFPLTQILRDHPKRWEIRYEDNTAVVFVPVTEPKP